VFSSVIQNTLQPTQHSDRATFSYTQLQEQRTIHSWGFALREGVFAETKEGICRNKDKKRLALKIKKNQEKKSPKTVDNGVEFLVRWGRQTGLRFIFPDY